MGKRYWNEIVETMPKEEVVGLQEENLRSLLTYVGRSSDFYKRKFEESGMAMDHIKGIRDLSKLPFTTKDELRLSQERFPPFGDYLAVPANQVRRIHRTAGTTGRPLYIALTEKDIGALCVSGARCVWAAGIRPGDRVMHCFNFCLYMGGYSDITFFEHAGVAVVPFGVGNSKLLVRTMKDVRARAIYCTPSYLRILSPLVKEELGIEPRDLGLKIAIISGEAGIQNPSYREEIENMWGLKTVDVYGMSDVLTAFASECEYRSGFHLLAPDYLLIELIDPTTGERKEIADGEVGEFVYTTLQKEGQPLIRYRSGDAVKIVGTDRCGCGRTGFRFIVSGRSDEMLAYKGVKAFPIAIQDAISVLKPDITGEIQLIAKGMPVESVTLKVEYEELRVESDRVEEMTTRIEDRVRQINGMTVRVELVATKDWKPVFTQTGKIKKLIRV
ncbi:MAG: AMP-binding protein [Thaumarchaeota archaeon]|nr:AMP-binding protein [Nitrososphaerota archaeon]